MSQYPGEDEPFVPRRTLGTSQEDEPTQISTFGTRLTAAMSSAGQALGAAAAATAEAARDSARQPAPAPQPSGQPRIRRARLRLVHIDPWSVMKMSFLLSVAIGVMTVIAVAVVWTMIGATGIWDSINTSVGDILSGGSGSTFDIRNYVGTGRIVGFTMLVAVLDVILITAISTLAAFLYNMAADLLGGVEVTLAEEH